MKKISLIYTAGMYESRGRMRGLFLGSSDGWLYGRYRGTNQSHLSKIVGPPGKFPYIAPTILWILGFFVVMAFAGRGRLSTLMAIVSMVYLFLLPAYLLGALFSNLFLRAKKLRTWERKFMCQRCGNTSEIGEIK